MQPLQWPQRDALCGELGAADAGRRVRLCGWVALRRNHAGLTFLTLRDSSGMVQVSHFRSHVVRGTLLVIIANTSSNS
jgi:aspartyl-tRNA synthetase